MSIHSSILLVVFYRMSLLDNKTDKFTTKITTYNKIMIFIGKMNE